MNVSVNQAFTGSGNKVINTAYTKKLYLIRSANEVTLRRDGLVGY